MRFRILAAVLVSSSAIAWGLGACSSSDNAAEGGGDDSGIDNPDGSTTADGTIPDGSTSSDAAKDAPGFDSARKDGDTDLDGAIVDDGSAPVDAGPPAVQFIGRFDEGDINGPRMAWPGTRVVARFQGADATVRLSRTHNGYQGGPSWFNVIVDGVVQDSARFSVSGFSEDHVVAQGLDPNSAHTVQIEKRTEANHGTVRFEGFTFPGGGTLLSPPARLTRRIEFIGDSTIDGFGVEGDRVNKLAANWCGENVAPVYGLAPPQFDNVRKSLSAFTAVGLSAEAHFTAYSGKGISVTSSGPADLLTMPIMFNRALPDPNAGTAWNHANWVPDAVVISLGGVDFEKGVAAAPADFQTKYAQFVADIRTKYGAAPYIFLTVWSQIKDNSGDNDIRTACRNALDGVVATRAGLADNKVYRFQFPEANVDVDEVGCQYHAIAAHHQAMADLLVTEIKAKTGW